MIDGEDLTKLLLVVLIAYFAFSFLYPLFIGNSIYSCATIEKKGFFQLEGDVSPQLFSKSDCIVIKSSDVELDCRGHSITSARSLNAAAISAFQLRNITLKNCVIKNNELGIFFEKVEDSKLKNITILSDNSSWSIEILNSTGIYVQQLSLQIKNNSILKSGGMFIAYSNNTIISDFISENTKGLTLYSSFNNGFMGLTISGSARSSLSLYVSRGNSFGHLSLNGNPTGIFLSNSNGNSFIDGNLNQNANHLNLAFNSTRNVFKEINLIGGNAVLLDNSYEIYKNAGEGCSNIFDNVFFENKILNCGG